MMSGSSLLDENECEILWNVEESHKMKDGYSYYKSPCFASSSGSNWTAVLQSANSNQFSTYEPDFVRGSMGKAWRLDLVLPYKVDFEMIAPINFSKNCSFFSFSYIYINASEYAFDIVLKLKKEMNSPPIFLPCHAKRYLKQIRVVVSVASIVDTVKKTCSLAHEKMVVYLCSLYADERYSDIKIKVDNIVFPAHKSILAAHSKVFEAMFDANMVEKETGTVSIKDLKPEAVKKLLEFMYKQKDPGLNTFQQAEDVYRAAHMYQVDHLTHISTMKLFSLLNETNVLDMLVLGQQYSDAVLKNKAISFIISHPDQRLDSDKCKAIVLENPDLFEFLFECLRRSM